MKRTSLVFFAFCMSAIAGCSTQTTQDITTVGCIASAVTPAAIKAADTIATIVDPSAVADINSVAAVDQAVHPLVQGACSAVLPGSVPVPGTVNTVSVPVAPASSVLPNVVTVNVSK